MTKWNEILNSKSMARATTQFALGLLSANDWYYTAVGCEVGPQTRQVVKSRRAVNARSIARKALKRRGMLSGFNLPR